MENAHQIARFLRHGPGDRLHFSIVHRKINLPVDHQTHLPVEDSFLLVAHPFRLGVRPKRVGDALRVLRLLRSKHVDQCAASVGGLTGAGVLSLSEERAVIRHAQVLVAPVIMNLIHPKQRKIRTFEDLLNDRVGIRIRVCLGDSRKERLHIDRFAVRRLSCRLRRRRILPVSAFIVRLPTAGKKRRRQHDQQQ